MESALVTGASGFVGRHLVARLLADGVRVTALLRPSSGPLPEHPQLTTVRGDLNDEAWILSHLREGDVLFHVAARVSDWGTVEEICRDNVGMTQALLGAASKGQLSRFVHVSSTDVYGHPGVPDWSEDRAHAPRHFNWYAATKRDAEEAVRSSVLPWVIARPATIYGPGSHAMMGEFADTLAQGFMLLVNGGRSLAGLVHVRDVVEGLLLCARHPAACGQAFNLSATDDVSWRKLVDDMAHDLGYSFRPLNLPWSVASSLGLGLECGYRLVRRATGLACRPLLSRQAVQILGVDQSFSHALATDVLGYTPQVSYREGLAGTVEWLQQRKTVLTPT